MKISIIIPSRPNTNIDNIKSMLKKVDTDGYQVEYFFVSGLMPPLQRNQAIQKASGDFIFFFDDDVQIPNHLIKNTLQYFDLPNVAVVGGPTLAIPQSTFFSQLCSEIMASTFGTGPISVRYKQAKINTDATEKDIHGCFMCFRGAIIKKNLFREDLFPNDENELLNRIKKNGYKIYYIPECFVYHQFRSTLRSYIKQVFTSGRGRAEQTLKEGLTGNGIYYIPLIFFTYLTVLPLAITQSSLFLLPLFIYILLSCLFGYFIYKKKNTLFFLYAIPIFWISHLTYAMGLLKGLISPYFRLRSEIHNKLNIITKNIHLK